MIREDIKRIFNQGFYRDVQVHLEEEKSGEQVLVYRSLKRDKLRQYAMKEMMN